MKDFEYGNVSYGSQGSRLKTYSYIFNNFPKNGSKGSEYSQCSASSWNKFRNILKNLKIFKNENGSYGSHGSQCSESSGYKFKTPLLNLKDFEYGNGSYGSQGSRLKR